MACTPLRTTALADEASELLSAVRGWLGAFGVADPESHPLYLQARRHAIQAEEDNGFVLYAVSMLRRSSQTGRWQRDRRADFARTYGETPRPAKSHRAA